MCGLCRFAKLAGWRELCRVLLFDMFCLKGELGGRGFVLHGIEGGLQEGRDIRADGGCDCTTVSVCMWYVQ